MPLGARLVLIVLFGVAGWQRARHDERTYGATPFGWPDWVWGCVTGFSLLLGVVLLAVGERPLRSRAATPVPAGYGYGPMTPVPAPVVPAQPVAQQPVVQQPVAQQAVAQAGVQAVPAQPVVADRAAAAGWHPDPSGRHQYRWWDGAAWTANVATGGVVSVDA